MSVIVQAQDQCAPSPHYERYFYSDKVRKFPIETKSRKADLIRTIIYCPTTSSNILYMLQADFDFEKVTDSTFIIDDKIAWEPIQAYLKKNHPYFLDYIFSVTRSYGGRGLSLGFSISPMKLEEKSHSCQRAAKGALKNIYQAFELAGCGIDKAAFGLNRLCANWQNKEKSLYYRKDIKNRVERSREPALSLLLKEMNKDPLLAYKKKREQADKYLWHHESTERGLAKLFDALFEDDYTLQASIKDLKELTGLNEATLRTVFNKPPKWLLTEWINKREGWSLGLSQNHMGKFCSRVQRLLNEKEKPKKKAPTSFNIVALKRPEEITQGERNLQLTNYLLRFKWMGVEFNKALKRLQCLSSLIPNQMGSRNLGESRIKAKAKCIYFSSMHHKSFGIRPKNHDYPDWLLNGYSSLAERKKSNVIKNLEAPWRVRNLQKNLEKPSQEKTYRKVSLDRHFKWKTQTRTNKKGKKVIDYCFYSVPFRPKKGVLVTEKDGFLKVFDAETGSYICQHEKQLFEPYKYFTQEKHMNGLSLDWFIDLLGKEYPEKKVRWNALYKAGSWRTYRKILNEKREIESHRKIEGYNNAK